MSVHEEINQALREELSRCDDERISDVMPATLAERTYARFRRADDDIHVRYGCVEHFKQMARALLAAKFDPDAERSESEAYQGDMFSGHLQSRYPLPHRGREEPRYRPRELLSTTELDWNIAALRKSADARLRHADALQSYRDARDK
jgi:hypothetical protein